MPFRRGLGLQGRQLAGKPRAAPVVHGRAVACGGYQVALPGPKLGVRSWSHIHAERSTGAVTGTASASSQIRASIASQNSGKDMGGLAGSIASGLGSRWSHCGVHWCVLRLGRHLPAGRQNDSHRGSTAAVALMP
jgi:hypothetical protein